MAVGLRVPEVPPPPPSRRPSPVVKWRRLRAALREKGPGQGDPGVSVLCIYIYILFKDVLCFLFGVCVCVRCVLFCVCCGCAWCLVCVFRCRFFWRGLLVECRLHSVLSCLFFCLLVCLFVCFAFGGIHCCGHWILRRKKWPGPPFWACSFVAPKRHKNNENPKIIIIMRGPKRKNTPCCRYLPTPQTLIEANMSMPPKDPCPPPMELGDRGSPTFGLSPFSR